MDHLRGLLQHFKDKHPSLPFPRASEELFTHIQTTLMPHALAVVQKSNVIFVGSTAAQIFPGIDITTVWDRSEDAWKKLHMTLVYSFMQGDPKEKIGKIIEAVKTMLPGSGGAQTDEILKILEDDGTESSLMEMFELLVNTRLATVVGDLVGSLDLDDLGIDFENPEALLVALQHPESSDVVQTIMKRVQELLQEKISTGKIDQRELIREIETLRAKFQSSFGKYMNEMVVGARGNTTGTDARTLMSNSPDARRARMLARLQKKQREKSRK